MILRKQRLVSEIGFRCAKWAALLFLFAAAAGAATWTVTTTADSGPGSLRDAIAAAAGGDTINFSVTGTIALNSTLSITGPGPMVIQGPAEGTVTIDGGGMYRVFDIAAGAQVTIDHLTIAHGNATFGGSPFGGGIYSSGTLTVTNSTFSDNSATTGGSIYTRTGHLTVTDSTFSANIANGGYGGAIYTEGTLTVTNSNFSDNSATMGGGIYNFTGQLAVINCTFSANIANGAGTGGGIYSTGTLTVTNSAFFANTATGTFAANAGAISSNGSATVTNSTFVANSASSSHGGNGGAINHNTGTLTVINSTFSANSANGSVNIGGVGGAICSSASTSTVINNIFSDNSAPGGVGGGIFDVASPPTASHNVYYNNTAALGPAVYGFTLDATSVDAADAVVGGLGDHGGPTQTMLPMGAAICAGSAATAPATDQRGLPMDLACPAGFVDAGAVQLAREIHLSVAGPATATAGTALAFTVTALDANGATMHGYAGTVHFTSTDAQASLPADSTLTGGVGTFSVTLRTPGGQTISVADAGNASITGSAAVAVSAVSAAPVSMVKLTASPSISMPRQMVTFIATVSASDGGSPQGTVEFFDGATLLAMKSIEGREAVFSTAALSAGTHSITARYGGGGTYPAAEAHLRHEVKRLATTIALAAIPSSGAVTGQTVTLAVSVSPAAAQAGFDPPRGEVTFTLESGRLFVPGTPLGTVPVQSGRAALSVDSLPAGTRYIKASYGGGDVWAPGFKEIPVTVSPAPAGAAAVSLKVSLTLVDGRLVLTGALAAESGSGSPTGSVQFVDMWTGAVVATAAVSNSKSEASIAPEGATAVLGRAIAAVYSGDANFLACTSTPLPVIVNAASYDSARLAADAIATVFGVTGLEDGSTATLLNVTDSAGANRPTLLFGVYPAAGQINFQVPGGTAPGLASVTIALPDGATLDTVIEIADTAPGIFTANMTGQGAFAGSVVYIRPNGSRTRAAAAIPNPGGEGFSPNAIGLNAQDRVYLELYGTGIRHASELTATVNGVSVPVSYFGPQEDNEGLDQINLGPLPASLAGAGVVSIAISADGAAANVVKAAFR